LGVSNDIKESKERKVFLREYKALKNPAKINDTLSIFVKSAWLESAWRYSGSEAEKAEIINDKSTQIKIITNNTLEQFNRKWQIQKLDFSEESFYKGYLNSIVGTFSSIPKNDTLTFKIYKGNTPQEMISQNYLGKIILIKTKQIQRN